MEVRIDRDVEAVAEFMQRNVPAEKLMGVTNRLAQIASLLWGHHEAKDVGPMRLAEPFGDDPVP